ncbi:MAG: hypothetical protein RIG77_00690 [Cyclobacteriaceae bacterium]
MGTILTLENVAIKYGLYTFIGLVAFFLFMKFAGLFQITELRGLNFFIMVAGIWKALTYYKLNSRTHLSYLEGLGLGTLTGMVAVIPFAAFIMSYLLVDKQFMAMLIEREPFGEYLNPYNVSVLIALEGIFSGAMVAFGMMQYLKKKQINA